MRRSRLALVSLTAVTSLALAGCSSGSSTSTAAVSTSPSPSPSSTTASQSACVADPHAHVYSPDRLRLLAACVSVTGIIDAEQPQEDGDIHVRLRVDPGQTCAGKSCLNGGNSEQAGDLLLEPVCEVPIAQADAVSACEGYHNPLVLPPVNSHVTAAGSWVLDLDHGWNEIHPLDSITVLSAPPPVPSPTPTASAAPAALFVTITSSSYGFVAATTLPGASCTAQAKLPSGRISTAAGLQATAVAGDDGAVSWTYNTSSTTKPGTGTHMVTCVMAGKTVSASAAFTVS